MKIFFIFLPAGWFSLPLQPWQKKTRKKDDYTLEEFKRWKNLLKFLGCRESKGGYYNLLRKKYFVNSETLKRKLKKYIRLSQTNYIERCAVGNVMRALFIFCATKVITFWKQIFIFIHYTLLMKFQRLYSSPCLHKTYWGNKILIQINFFTLCSWTDCHTHTQK